MKQTTTKEVLHTQGKWTFTNSNNDDYIDIDVDGNRVCSIFLIAQEEAGVSQKECEANAELICQAVNERQKLLALIDSWHEDVEKLSNSNKELLEALEEITEMSLRWSEKGLTPTIYKAEKAINNAKNI